MAAIIILGGHRTGTSLTARLVHELGFPAAPSPGRLLAPRGGHESDNPDGYYEDVAFLRLHRRMLGEHLASTGGWRNPCRNDAEILRLRDRYRGLIVARAESSPAWSFKDPRLCLLGDLLFTALTDLGIPFRVVTTRRPVIEVVTSLMRRGLPESDAARIAETFEAGQQAMLSLAANAGVPCLELWLASERTEQGGRSQVRDLQRFLGAEDAALTESLTKLVRFNR
ncbi:hypothetical protein Pan44_24630 [Caulifigura coniformis]|uniref:Sulfotransferase family protein n=1 Tax=Caulifigura coniformis TaxID=2527983 RepID=A0A517SE76_9PLAN|nr:hypothetical protein [Caulifigura coniformis]QDT54430.1 hypothetical protein Pan44_24630 [Caulifigura coniformis]